MKYYYSLNGTDYTQFYPMADNISFDWTKEDMHYFLRQSIGGDLIIFSEGAGTEYNTFKGFEDSYNYIDFKVLDDDDNQIFIGKLSILGEYNPLHETIKLAVTNPTDDYKTLIQNREVKKNILSAEMGSSQTVSISYPSTVYTVTLPCNSHGNPGAQDYYLPDGTAVPSPPDRHSDWAQFSYIGDDGTGCDPGDYKQTYKCQKIFFDPQDASWEYSTFFTETWIKPGAASTDVEVDFTNARKLYDVVKYLVQQADSTIDISESTYCTYLTGKTDLDNIHVIQKSDAKDPDASNKASVQMMSFQQLVDLMYNKFQLKWYIDGGYFKFIHPSQYSETTDIDLSDYTYNGYSYGDVFVKNLSYKYSEDIPIREVWNVENPQGLDFGGGEDSNIEYDIDSNDEKKYDVAFENSDLGNVMTDTDKISSEGIVMVACDGSDNIVNKAPIIGVGSDIINGKLALSYLHQEHWKHDRYDTEFTMNGSSTNASSLKRLKKLSGVVIPYDLNAFDSTKLVVLHSGSITEFSDYSGTVSGATRLKSVGHNLNTKDQIIVSGTPYYDGNRIVFKIDDDYFYILVSYIPAASGTFKRTAEIMSANYQNYKFNLELNG